MGDTLYAILLGIVQGITEFLPVSSSAHLIVTSNFYSGETLPLALNVALHFGTLFAVLLYFWRDWFEIFNACFERIAKGKPSFLSDKLVPYLLVATIPAAAIGLGMQDLIEATFHNPISTCAPLAVVGLALWYVDLKRPSTRTTDSLRWIDVILIGFAQASALIPGVSRSGATITAGRFLGLSRTDAAKFSFLLGTPAMGGAALLKADEILASLDQPIFYIGFLTSLVTGCAAIGFLMKFIRHFGFLSFAIYRVGLAIVIYLLVS